MADAQTLPVRSVAWGRPFAVGVQILGAWPIASNSLAATWAWNKCLFLRIANVRELGNRIIQTFAR